MGSAVPEEDTVEAVWEVMRSEESIYSEVKSDLVWYIDNECKKKINSGDYDATVAVQDVYRHFRDEHLTGDSDFVEDVLDSGRVIEETIDYDRERIARILFRRLLEELEDEGDIIYVYDRQRVRSYAAEVARYFSLVRQRVNGEMEYDFAPSLVKMVKMDVLRREQPKWGEEGVSKTRPLREIVAAVNDEEPGSEFRDTFPSRDGWVDSVEGAMETMNELFGALGFERFAKYQSRAIKKIYLDSVTEGEDDASHVVTASTGGGKTEAFLFPVLAYCLTAREAGIEGTKAVLTYPRQDLCDNQFERVVNYVRGINEILGEERNPYEESPVTVKISHSNTGDISMDCPYEGCGGEIEAEYNEETYDHDFVCGRDERHEIRFATTSREKPSDISISTPNSLHLRLMDKYGNQSLLSSSYPPKFVVLDEVHVYTEQDGMHVANLMRRLKRSMREVESGQDPVLVASSATIENAEDFTKRIFNTGEATEISPTEDEKEETDREYIVFVKSTDPRDVEIPVGDSVVKPREMWDDVERTTASNLSCMIQIAFCFYHTILKEEAGDREGLEVDKDKILGFVDSIDSVSRLGWNLDDAETQRRLFSLRRPDAFLSGEGDNPDCPKDRFRQGTDDGYDERAVCESLPPNKHLNECPVYEAGECWWTMDDEKDLREMEIAIHKSGSTQSPDGDNVEGDEWDMMISTSALEVGFDHPSIIGTFQYRAPMNVPGFVQRKGRGGRDTEDSPITVAVLGSSPTDSFYFHHSDHLSRPKDEHLTVPLDEENRFVRTEHITASVFDYINATTGEQVYEDADIERLSGILGRERADIEGWIKEAFDADDDEVEDAIGNLEGYVESLLSPAAPGLDDTISYIDLFHEAVNEGWGSGKHDRTERLLEEYREETNVGGNR